MSIFIDEVKKFKIEIKEIFDNAIIKLKNIIEYIYRLALRILFYGMAITLIYAIILPIGYYVLMHFNLIKSFSDYIFFVIASAACLLLYILIKNLTSANDSTNSSYSHLIKSEENESLKIQRDILKTQKRIAASNQQIEFQSWISSNKRNE